MAKQYIKTSSNGDKFYYKDPDMTIRHRTDGPASITPDGEYKAWYTNGERHRVDGPAIEYGRGDKVWYINDVFIFEADSNGNIIRRMK